MTLLAYTELCELIDQGVISNVTYKHVNSASIDLTLGDDILVEASGYPSSNTVDLSIKEVPHFNEYSCALGYDVHPKQFILAHSMQVFNLPNNISALYVLNSSLARAGLNHMNAGWADAGWNGSVLTFEFFNVLCSHALKIRAGMKAGQMLFFKHAEVPNENSYAVKGQYNGDTSAQSSKGLRGHNLVKNKQVNI